MKAFDVTFKVANEEQGDDNSNSYIRMQWMNCLLKVNMKVIPNVGTMT
jgi:hypothetical protein